MSSPGSATGQAVHEISLSFILARLWAAKVLISLLVIAITGLVYLYTQSADPLYRSEAQVLIEPQETAFTRPQAEDGQPSVVIDERDIASQVQILQSRDLALEVIRDLDLTAHPLFDPTDSSPSFVQSMMILLGFSDDPLLRSVEERVVRKFASGLSVFSIPSSRVIVVVYESEDPDLSAQIANALVDQYQADQQAAQAANTQSATSFLETEIDQLRGEVAAAEAAVARFRTGSGLVLGANQTTLSAQRLSELNSEVVRARSEQSQAQSRADEVRALVASQGSRLALPDGFATPLTESLESEQAALRGRIAELSASLLPGHPRIQELNAQLSDLAQQARNEARRIAARFDNEAQVAAARADGLEDQLAGLRAEAARLAEAEVELLALEREAAAQRDLLASYLVRFREAATRDDAAMLPTNARIIQTAQVDRDQVFPQTLSMVAIAFVGSAVMAVLAVVSHAILASAVPGERLREPGFDAAPLGDPVQRPDVVALSRPSTPEPSLPTAYAVDHVADRRALMNHLMAHASPGHGTRVTFAGLSDPALTGVGALSLARAMAEAGAATVFIDAVGDLHGTLALPDGPGFNDLLTGAVSFDAALHGDPDSDLHIVPAGYAVADPAMVANDAADLIFSALAEAYDLVIINASRDAERLVECAGITDAVAISGTTSRSLALVSALEPVLPSDRIVMVQANAQVASAA